ncbi:hypothetical protein TUMSATVNIG1_57990 (plasmid) [Vibrio nigripulchritudo]|nr:hypothetical protein VNTUMSATTG_57500 [Vibrio nigripulchritudo]BDU35190.1 hypothetical protein TUMSATVNIG1_57990 [Vibrio nigripulchritudo]
MRVSLNNHFFFTVVIGGDVCFDYIDLHWKGILRLSALIGKGVVTASLVLGKLGIYPDKTN